MALHPVCRLWPPAVTYSH